jgi:hypothetical protein
LKQPFKPNDPVSWKWYDGVINGVVVEAFLEPIVKEIKGKKIKRNGSPENPAYLVKSEAGNLALKLGTELQDQKSPNRKRRPDVKSEQED